ncbi:uncharacterized protein [Cherax quadricarinatus]|nr:uncharacterized protein LOC128695176 isoform X2 [Cherax quadricarinatus]
MLKFRVTNSTKARRAAEAQRRALEEKFQLEWAWKPMAAMMNEDKADLVYFIPPLYSSNLVGPAAPRRPSLSRSYTLAAAATERKRRLATRRTKMTSEQIGDTRRDSQMSQMSQMCDRRDSAMSQMSQMCDRRDSAMSQMSQMCDRRDSAMCDRRDSAMCDRRDSHIIPELKEDLICMKDPDTESGIHMGHSREDLPRRSFQSIQEERFPELQRPTFAGRPKVRCTSMKLRPPEKVCEGMRRASDSAAMKSKTLPSIFRLLKPSSYNQKNKHLSREVESRCYGSKKVKRPSIKIYNPPSRLSNRRARSSFSQNEEDDPCVFVSIDPKARESARRLSIAAEQQRAQAAAKALSGDSPKIRHAHLQMVLRLLAQMYEEKVVHQDSEIKSLKSKLQIHDKHLKRMVQMILHLKDEVNKMKNQRIAMTEQMKDIQNGILSVKMGVAGRTGIDV